MENLSAELESANIGQADKIRAGTLYAAGTIRRNTADFVHFEQTKVQSALDALKKNNPSEYAAEISSANTSLNGSFGQIARVTDPTFAAAAAVTRKALGRNIDFSKQSDRESLGNAVANQILKSSSFCTGSHVTTCAN